MGYRSAAVRGVTCDEADALWAKIAAHDPSSEDEDRIGGILLGEWPEESEDGFVQVGFVAVDCQLGYVGETGGADVEYFYRTFGAVAEEGFPLSGLNSRRSCYCRSHFERRLLLAGKVRR